MWIVKRHNIISYQHSICTAYLLGESNYQIVSN